MAVPILSRSEWGALPPKRPPARVKMLDGMTFHWNGGGLGNYKPEWVPTYLRSTQNFHMFSDQLAIGGASDIAYNLGIDRFGRVWEARGWDVWNAASGGSPQNATSVAVELILGKGDPFPDVVKQTMVSLCQDYLAKGPDRQPHWYGHKDWIKTECPGEEIYSFIKNDIPDLLGSVTVPTPRIGEDPMRCFKDPNETLWIIRDDKKIRAELIYDFYQLSQNELFPALDELFKIGLILDNPRNAPALSWNAMALIQNGAVE